MGAILAVIDKITNNHGAISRFRGYGGSSGIGRFLLLQLLLHIAAPLILLYPAMAEAQQELLPATGVPAAPAQGEFVAPLKILTPEGLLEPRALRQSLQRELNRLGYGPWPKVPAPAAAEKGQGFVWPYKELLYRGTPADSLSSYRYSQPVLCQLGDHIVAFLERGNVLNQEVAGISYRVLGKVSEHRRRSPKNRRQNQTSALNKAAVAAIAALATTPWPKSPWPTGQVRGGKLRLSLQGYPPGRSSICWNLAFLAEAKPLPAVFVSSFASAYRSQLVRTYLGEHSKKSRPHLQVMAFWQKRSPSVMMAELRNQSGINGQHIAVAPQNPALSPLAKSSLPAAAKAERQAERQAAPNLQATISVSANSGVSRIQVVYPKSWFTFLQIEADRLVHLNPPRIVARYGTWAYLDRGRGYGLTINQRFVGMQAGSSRLSPAFAGHVVKFFGYSAGIKDADGQAIVDGAIIYLRSGRDKAVIGSPVFPDQATYP